MNIGDFALAKNGGWIGIIHTLTLHAKIKLVPNDNIKSENAPAFRVLFGRQKIGDAWEAITKGDTSKQYLRVRIDDPLFSEPITAALFPSETGNSAKFVWKRRKEE